MYRSIYVKMKEWKEQSQGKTALLIDGARRIGKSYIAKEFAKNEYKSFLLLDFNNISQDIKDLFDHYLTDLDQFFFRLSLMTNTTLYNRKSVIIFDEIQMFPKARGAIKYLVEDGRYDYIETGSLISIKKNVKDIMIPSEERHLKMYPMDFYEFLMATGNQIYQEGIEYCFKSKKQLGNDLFRKINDAFNTYLVVGGMPQAVLEFIKSGNFREVDIIKRDILNLYQADIGKYADKNDVKVRNIFNQIPAQLDKNEKKFKLSSISENARFREYEDAFFWLSDSMIVNIAYNTTEPDVGLRLNTENSTFKCYMGDTGLLISFAFDEKGIVEQEIYQKIIKNKLEFNSGMIIENIVAQMLVSSNHQLYFYSNPGTKDRSMKMEIDFLLAKNQISSRHNIIPVEVKSGENYTFNSLNKYRTHFSSKVTSPIVLHSADLKIKDDITYLPLFMVSLL